MSKKRTRGDAIGKYDSPVQFSRLPHALLVICSACLVAVMTGCTGVVNSQEPSPSSESTVASPTPEPSEDEPLNNFPLKLLPGVKRLAPQDRKVTDMGYTLRFAHVKDGTFHIVVNCLGQGSAAVSMPNFGEFTVPCDAHGYTTFNEIVFLTPKDDVEVFISKPSPTADVKVLTGWSSDKQSPPTRPATAV